jgi:hypothetical protein
VKKSFKYKSNLLGKEVVLTFTHNPELDKLQGKKWAPKKLEEVNKLLRNLKMPLPK